MKSRPTTFLGVAGAGALAAAAAALAAKPPQVSVLQSVVHDAFESLDDCAHAVVLQGGKPFVAGYVTGAANGRNASMTKFTAKLQTDGGYSFDGNAHGGDEFHAVATNVRGEFFTVGHSTQPGRGRDVFVQKYMKNLRGAQNAYWHDEFRGDDEGYGVAVAKDRTVWVTGTVSTPATGADVWLGRFDADVNLIDARSYDGPAGGNDTGRAVAVDHDGNLVVVGSVVRPDTGFDVWIGKFAPDLTLVDEAWVAGEADSQDIAYGLVIDRKRRIWVVGAVGVAGEGMDFWLGGFDSDLEPLGTVTRSGATTGDDNAFAVAADERGHLFVAGRTTLAGGGTAPWIGVFDTHLAFVAETTNTEGAAQVAGTSDRHDGAYDLAMASSSTLVVVGGLTKTADQPDIWVAKYKALRLPVVRKP